MAQIELEAEAICDLFRAALEADQVARCGNNIGLPSVSMILANNDFHTSCADLAFDHTGKLHGTNALSNHGEAPAMRCASRPSGQQCLKDPSKNMVDPTTAGASGRLVQRRARPHVPLLVGRQDYRHRVKMDRLDRAFGAVKRAWSSRMCHICRTINEFGGFLPTQ
jgi:hypothetical protein